MKQAETNYTAEEILEIFKEQHRLCSPLDPEAEPWAEITADMTISDWRWANDLVGWDKMCAVLNQEFRVEIEVEAYFRVLEPARSRKLNEVCELLAMHAKKDAYEPKTLLGTPCLKAGVFLTIKENLKNKGVDVTELKPSSLLSTYMNKYFSPIIEEITLTGPKPIEKIEVRSRKKGFWNAINIFDPDRYDILTGEIKTFRDLTEVIIEEKTSLHQISGANCTK